MGLRLKRRKETPPEIPIPEKLAALSTDDVYLMIESALMEAQYRLSQYRTSSLADKIAHLEWMRTSLGAAQIGIEEFSRRINETTPPSL